MLEFFLIIIWVPLGAIAYWAVRTNWAERTKKARYECNFCGEYHCECTLTR